MSFGVASLLPFEAYDVLISDVAPDDFIAAVKSSEHFRARLFQGFRPTAQAARNPVVHQRAAREAANDPAFLDLLISLWMLTHADLPAEVRNMRVNEVETSTDSLCVRFGGASVYLALMLDGRRGLRRLAESSRETLLSCAPERPAADKPRVQPEQPPVEDHRLKASRERAAGLQKENRLLARKLTSAEKTREAAERTVTQLREELQAALRSGSESARKADRAARNLATAKQKSADLERTVQDLRRALDAKSASHGARTRQTDAPWQTAVAQLIREKKIDTAVDFLTALSDAAGDDARPHEMLLKAYALAKRKPEQKHELVWLGKHYFQNGDLATSIDRLARALALDENAADVKTLISRALARVDPRNEKRTSEVRRALVRLRSGSPQLYDVVMAIAAKVSAPLHEALRSVPSHSDLDVSFRPDREDPTQFTPRELIRAVNANDAEMVKAVRGAMRKMPRDSRGTLETVRRAIEDHDPSIWTALTAETEPVIVDASNVANYLAPRPGKARLSSILAVRRELRRKRYFPVYLIADAALRHQIDDPDELERMLEAGEVEFAPPRTDADEMMLTRARGLECSLVTRDQMADWDPQGIVHKIKFDIDRGSAEILDIAW